MGKFKHIETKLLGYSGNFSHLNVENMLKKEPTSDLDFLLSDMKLEEEAKELLISIKPDLEGYLLSVINKMDFILIKRNSINRYNKDLKKIKISYLTSQVKEQIKKLKTGIVEKRNRHSLFVDIYNSFENNGSTNLSDLKSYFAKKSAESYLNEEYGYQITIKKITNYPIDLADFIFYNTIFHHLDQPGGISLSFKDLFESEDLYNKAIKILVENRFVERKKNGLKWIYPKSKGLTTRQTIIALFVVLERKHYFKYNLQSRHKYIEAEFNVSMHKSTFSRSSDQYRMDYNTSLTTSSDYLSLFKDIL